MMIVPLSVQNEVIGVIRLQAYGNRVFTNEEVDLASQGAMISSQAIEIAKRFSGEEAALYINGVLDAVRRTLGLPESPRKVKDHEPRAEEKQGRSRPAGGDEKKRPGARPGRKS